MTREELLDAEEYADIVDDITCELETKYGALSSIVIPKPSQGGILADPPGVGLVFVQFAAATHAVRSLFGSEVFTFTTALVTPFPLYSTGYGE